MRQLEFRFTPKLGEIRLASRVEAFPFRFQVARRFVGERLALVGDAAHRRPSDRRARASTSGLRDVAALAETVVGAMRLGLDPGAPATLADYQRARRFDVAASGMGMDVDEPPVLQRLRARCASSRDLGLRLVDRAPPLKDLLIVEAGGAGAARRDSCAASRCEREPRSPRTLAAQALGRIDEATRALVPPLHVSSTFIRDPDNAYRSGDVYGRPDNQTVREAEAVIGALEGAAETLVFGSGMSAAVALFLSLGRRRACRRARRDVLGVAPLAHQRGAALRPRGRVRRHRGLRRASSAPIRPARQARLAGDAEQSAVGRHRHRPRRASPMRPARCSASTSTCATPIFTRPLALGADVVMHSATKYLNGHSDADRRRALLRARRRAVERARDIRKAHGLILDPFEAFLLIRGLRTLDLRVRAAAANAIELAHRLSNHAAVAAVLYPGLPHHPGHEVAERQMHGGFGGMLSIRVRGGAEAAIAAAARVSLWKRATSLGGVESLIEHRASIEGADSPCPPDLLRLSAGIEDVEDLWRDLDRRARGLKRRSG